MLTLDELSDFLDDFDVQLDIDLSGDVPQYTAYTSYLPDVIEYGDYAHEAVELLWSSVTTTESILGIDLLKDDTYETRC